MEYLITTIIGLATGIAVMAMAEKAPRLSRWLIRRGAQFYIEPKASRFEEEWLAHLATRDGPYSMIWHGLGCLASGLRRGGLPSRTADRFATWSIVTVMSALMRYADALDGSFLAKEYPQTDARSAFFSLLQAIAQIVVIAPVVVTVLMAEQLLRFTSSEHVHVAAVRRASENHAELWHITEEAKVTIASSTSILLRALRGQRGKINS